jgi:hypothetical protein
MHKGERIQRCRRRILERQARPSHLRGSEKERRVGPKSAQAVCLKFDSPGARRAKQRMTPPAHRGEDERGGPTSAP